MDYNRILAIIDSDVTIKQNVLLKYISPQINSLNSNHYVVHYINSMDSVTLQFLNGQTFNFGGNLQQAIEMFEYNYPALDITRNQIENQLIQNHNDFITKLKDQLEIIKNDYFIAKDATLDIFPFDGYHVPTIGNIYIAGYTFNVSIHYHELYSCYQTILSQTIENLIDMIQRIITNSLNYGKYNARIYDNSINKQAIERAKDNSRVIALNSSVLHDEEYFKLMKHVMMNINTIDDQQQFIKSIITRYDLRVVDPDVPYDLKKGTVHLDNSMQTFNKTKTIYQNIINEINTFNQLCSEDMLKNMIEFSTFNEKIKLYKYDDKIINDNHYVIYKYNRLKKRGVIFFENGKRVGQSRYHIVSKLLGMNKKFTIEDKPKDEHYYWNRISMLPLSEEQIYQYEDKLNWWLLPLYRPLSLELLKKHCREINWARILPIRTFKYNWLTELAPLIGWKTISRYCKHEKFIRDNYENLDMDEILKNDHAKFVRDLINALL